MANHLPSNLRIRDAAFESDSVPQLVLDQSSRLVAVDATARRCFGVVAQDIGRSVLELDVSYRPAELRSALQLVLAENRPLTGGVILLMEEVAPS
jgi:two-component system, chemotaxis family, CheB/CheR fusion protein